MLRFCGGDRIGGDVGGDADLLGAAGQLHGPQGGPDQGVRQPQHANPRRVEVHK